MARSDYFESRAPATHVRIADPFFTWPATTLSPGSTLLPTPSLFVARFLLLQNSEIIGKCWKDHLSAFPLSASCILFKTCLLDSWLPLLFLTRKMPVCHSRVVYVRVISFLVLENILWIRWKIFQKIALLAGSLTTPKMTTWTNHVSSRDYKWPTKGIQKKRNLA